MINWDHYRQLFPACKNHTYLMSAAISPLPTPVHQAICQQYEKFYLHGGDKVEETLAIIEECRKLVGQLINAAPDNIAFIPNTSFGMNALALSLKTAKHHYETVILPSDEFPSSTLAWENAGYHMQFISAAPDLEHNMITALNENKNAIAVSSLVQFATGYHTRVTNLSAAARNNNSPLIINATQAIGSFQLDVQQNNIDAVVFASHKRLLCGTGIACLYISNHFFQQLKPAIVGWTSAANMWDLKNTQPHYKQSARIFEIGGMNLPVFAGLHEALKIILEIGVINIEQRILELMNYLITELQKCNIPIISNIDPHHRSGNLLLGPFNDNDKLLQQLHAQNILVTKRSGGIRVSLHFYNNEQDVEHFIGVMRQLT